MGSCLILGKAARVLFFALFESIKPSAVAVAHGGTKMIVLFPEVGILT